MAAAIECWPEISKRLSESSARSDMIKSAVTAMQSGDISGCVAVLGDLVEKSGGSTSVRTEVVEKRDDRTIQLMEKRNRLAAMLKQLKQITGAGKHHIGGHELPHAAAESRRQALQLRLDRLKSKLNAQLSGNDRSWQPMESRT